jgi:hypothetical protein
MGNLTYYGANKLLDHVLKVTPFTRPTHLYVALCTADPGKTATGSTITEPTDPDYARQIVDDWDTASGRATANSEPIAFPEASEDWDNPVTHWALCDAADGGNALAFGALPEAKQPDAGDDLGADAGEFDVSINTGGMSTYLANALLDHLFAGTPYTPPTNLYVCLLTSSATDSDAGSDLAEPGENYARELNNAWDAASSGVSHNTALVDFGQANEYGWGAIAYFALSDDPDVGEGNVLSYGSFAATKTIGNSDVAKIPAGQVAISLD